MNKEQIFEIDDLTLKLNFDLAILNSAISNGDDLEVCVFENFVESLYQKSEDIRRIFDNNV